MLISWWERASNLWLRVSTEVNGRSLHVLRLLFWFEKVDLVGCLVRIVRFCVLLCKGQDITEQNEIGNWEPVHSDRADLPLCVSVATPPIVFHRILDRLDMLEQAFVPCIDATVVVRHTLVHGGFS
jgi:hypothetical protein